MNPDQENFLRNEFLTMSVLGALGRSKTYSDSVPTEAKRHFLNTLRIKLDEMSKTYQSTVTENNHLRNIEKLSNDLSSSFTDYLRNGRFRIGIAQKALNLYLKYLWCVNLIATPPHCPFDSIIISHLPDCEGVSWTSIDTIEDYQKLVEAAHKKADGKPLAEWELEIWTNSVQSARNPADVDDHIPSEQHGERNGSMNGWKKTSAKFHDDLKQAMKAYRGRELKTSEINDIIKNNQTLSSNAQFIQPPDHCSNHTNKGACYCAMTEQAIFKKIRHGVYLVRNMA